MKTYIYKLKQNTVTINVTDKRIDLNVCGKNYFADYPERIEDEPQYLFDLLIWILFYGFDENHTDKWGDYEIEIPEFIAKKTPTIVPQHSKILLSYSGGVDSTAIYLAIKHLEPVLLNIYRSYEPVFNFNQQQVIQQTGCKYITTDFERIRLNYKGKAHGFNIGTGYMSMYFPLVNIYDIKYITFGTVFDDVGFWYGEPFKFNGFNKNLGRNDFINHVLSLVNLQQVFLFAGISEVWTVKLANNSTLKDTVCSCHTEEMTSKLCLHCYKCFRKLGMVGQKIPYKQVITDNIPHILTQKPLKMAASTIYGMQKGYRDEPDFQKYMDIDVSFLDRWCDAMQKRHNSPETYRLMAGIFEKLGIQKQTDEDERRIVKFVEQINNDGLY